MDKMPRRTKRTMANTVPTILLFVTRERVHRVRRVREERINAVEERRRSK
jgi:hypothetical protein